MRVAICAMLLGCGTAAFCQSAAPGAANNGKMLLNPPLLAQPQRDFNKPPAQWMMPKFMPPPKLAVPGDVTWKDDRPFDPGMVRHPPKSSLGDQALGALIAQNLYPGLRLLPIDESKLKLEPIPITWPRLKVEGIPTVFPHVEMTPVQNGAAGK